MSGPQVDLTELFAAAQQMVAAHQQDLNSLDGHNGNHGDNMVQNMRMIVDALEQNRDQPPAAALERAGQRLQSEGRGGTSQYYAQGLTKAAGQLQDRSEITQDDAMSVVQALLGSIPKEEHPERGQASGSVLEELLGMSGARSRPQEQANGPLGGLLKPLVPAALSVFRARQSGADSGAALSQALTSALVGSQHVDPLQTNNRRAAAGGLVGQAMLKALMAQRWRHT